VFEAALNVAMTGARPLAVVDNLNFGNPEKPEVMWQFRESIEGISEACETLGVPVVGGNVSFYNETDDNDIYPTPVVGMLGLVEPVPVTPPRLDRAVDGMEIWRFGPEWAVNLAGSALEQVTFAHVGGRPTPPDGPMAKAAVEAAIRLATEIEVPVLHDISEGGLAVAVAEICIASGTGARVEFGDWRHLFCEDPHRFLAVLDPDRSDDVRRIAAEVGLPAAPIGRMVGDEIIFEQGGVTAGVALGAATEVYRTAIARRMTTQEP
jgi:phosphoribosylformylglycinamidine synthase